jgi:PleD family two-component response regulator
VRFLAASRGCHVRRKNGELRPIDGIVAPEGEGSVVIVRGTSRLAHGAHVLIVKPDPEAARGLLARLARAGCSTELATTATAALARLDKRPADLVIVDASIAAIANAQLIALLRESHPTVPVIVASAGP